MAAVNALGRSITLRSNAERSVAQRLLSIVTARAMKSFVQQGRD
jgi:hypothetical protein